MVYYLQIYAHLLVLMGALNWVADGLDIDMGNGLFTVRSSVEVQSHQDDGFTLHAEESYSKEQGRARLDYRIIPYKLWNSFSSDRFKSARTRQSSEGILFHDLPDSYTILVNSPMSGSRKICQLVGNLTEFRETLLPMISSFEVDDDFEDLIIGPSRLLLFATRHRASMQLVANSTIPVRNVPASKYTLVHVNKKGQKLQMSIFYSQAASSSGLPRRISIVSKGFERVIVIDYLSAESGDNLALGRPEAGSEILLDKLNYVSESIGCAREIPLDTGKGGLFSSPGRNNSTTRFSFTANYRFGLAKMAGETSSFVAYSAALKSLRCDSKTSNFLRKGESERKFLANFHLNRVYMNNDNIGAAATDKFQTVAQIREQKSAQCLGRQLVSEREFLASENQWKLGYLLSGANREFIHAGSARVRGIAVQVYESFNSSAPFWLDPPIMVAAELQETGEGLANLEDRTRIPQRAVRYGNRSVIESTLVFVTERAQMPLLIEIYLLDAITLEQLDKRQISIHNFAWELNYDTTNGELFSLSNLCSDRVKRLARVEMVLESNEPINPLEITGKGLLNAPAETRGLALLASLQSSLRIPATMVYNLETRFASTGGRELAEQAPAISRLLVAFRVAEHTDCTIKLTFLGRPGKLAANPDQLLYTTVDSLQHCILLAAQRGNSILFTYNPASDDCYIDPMSYSERAILEKKLPLIRLASATEIYRLDCLPEDRGYPPARSWIRSKEAADVSKIRYMGRSLQLTNEFGDQTKGLLFHVKHLQLHEDLTDSGEPLQGAQVATKDGIKITGFGLSQSSSGCHRIEPNPSPGELPGQVAKSDSAMRDKLPHLALAGPMMSFEQCHASCLADFKCQSFSVCVHNFETICVISEFRLNQTFILEQVNKTARSSHQQTVQVLLEPNSTKTIPLIAYANCNLYIKQFEELFSRRVQVAPIIITNRRLYQVQGREQCAQLCADRNIEIVRQFGLVANSGLSHFEQIRQLYANSCYEFFYHDRESTIGENSGPNRTIDERLQRRVLTGGSESMGAPANGYCMLSFWPSEREKSELEEAKLYNISTPAEMVQFERHDFNNEIFYERQFGLRLLEAPISASEQAAYKKLSLGQTVSTAELAELDLRVKQMSNKQEIVSIGLKCANMCSRQIWGPWPACRSFDVVIEIRLNKYEEKCILNSITLADAVEAKRFELIDWEGKNGRETTNSSIQVWHYEPRAGFALGSAAYGKVSFAKRSSAGARQVVGGTFQRAVVCFIGLITGILMGIELSKRLIKRDGEQSRTVIVDQIFLAPTQAADWSNY